MERLLGVADIMERYRCCRQTASKRMHQMRHLENPLLVPEWAVTAWENEQMADKPKRSRKKMPLLITSMDDYHIPRRRA